MRTAAASFLVAAALAAPAHASPALHGTWSAAEVNGRPLVVQFDAGGNGQINGQPMRWQTLGSMLFIEQNGQVGTYSFDVKDGKFVVSGGDLPGVATLTKGTAAAESGKKQAAARQAKAAKGAPASGQPGAPAASGGQEIVGKWCNLAQFTANRGGSSRMECFQLNADGSYSYNYEGSMSGTTGSTASQSSDSGRWRYDGQQLVAQSRSGKVSTYTLEKRNHPKNKRDPMICLNGTCYVTFYNKPAW
jgi:hypothetical protein